MYYQHLIVRLTGGTTEAIAAVDAAIAALPRPGQTPVQGAAEQAKLEALKVRLEALP